MKWHLVNALCEQAKEVWLSVPRADTNFMANLEQHIEYAAAQQRYVEEVGYSADYRRAPDQRALARQRRDAESASSSNADLTNNWGTWKEGKGSGRGT